MAEFVRRHHVSVRQRKVFVDEYIALWLRSSTSGQTKELSVRSRNNEPGHFCKTEAHSPYCCLNIHRRHGFIHTTRRTSSSDEFGSEGASFDVRDKSQSALGLVGIVLRERPQLCPRWFIHVGYLAICDHLAGIGNA